MTQPRNETARDAHRGLRGQIFDLSPYAELRAAIASRSLNWRLGVATLKVVLPLIAAALIMVGWIAHSERQAKEELLIGDAHALANQVGRRIDKYFVLSSALSRSSLLQRGDFAGFETQAREILADTPEVTLLVSAIDGRPLLSAPPAASDSSLSRDREELVDRSLQSGSAFLSDVSVDPASHEAHASVETPVFNDGKPIYELALVFSLSEFDDLLERQNLPAGWLSGIIDRHGAFVARAPTESGLPGTLASEEFRNAAQREPDAIVSHNSIKGQQILSAYAAVPSGWTVGVGAASNRFAVGPSAFLLMAILALAALAASLILSFLSGRRLTRQMKELQTQAEQVFAGSPIAVAPTGILELDGLSEALAKASKLLTERAERQQRAETDLRKSEEHFRLLADSLPQLVWTARPDGRIEYTNARRERYGKGGLNRTDWESIIHPEDRHATAAAWVHASDTGAPYEMEHRLMAIGKGYTWHLSRATPLLDSQGAIIRWYGATTDIHDQKLREENIRFLMTEINHRSRNLLAVAQAIARRTVTTSKTAREFEEKFSERLLGLIANQDLLIDQNWRGVPLEALVAAQAALPAKGYEHRFTSDGPEILLSPSSAQTLGLALRELSNNAFKYGALSNDSGAVAVRWGIDDSGAEPMFEMSWREEGGPAVTTEPVRGFGSVLIERMVVDSLNGSAVLTFAAEGVTWRLRAPLKEIVTRRDPQPPAPRN
jgi:PAS domain S-box-containing protein